jgi:hypothetical protein
MRLDLPICVNRFCKEALDVGRVTEVGIVGWPTEKELDLHQQDSHIENKAQNSTIEDAQV